MVVNQLNSTSLSKVMVSDVNLHPYSMGDRERFALVQMASAIHYFTCEQAARIINTFTPVGAERRCKLDCICIVYLYVPVCVIEGGGGASSTPT